MARSICIILYDTDTQRGWLTDGASALLHLVLAKLSQKPFTHERSLFGDRTANATAFEYPLPHSGADGPYSALTKENNLKHVVMREFESYKDERSFSPPATAFQCGSRGYLPFARRAKRDLQSCLLQGSTASSFQHARANI